MARLNIKNLNYKGYSFYSLVLLSIVVLESLSIISIELITLSKSEFSCPVINVYIAIFIFSRIFQIILATDAIKTKNTIQLIGLSIFSVVCFGYSIIQIEQLKSASAETCNSKDASKSDIFETLGDKIRPPLIGSTVLLALVSPLYMFLCFKLFKEYGWDIYKKIGAHTEMKTMYLQYHIFLLLLKFGFFFFMGFSLQFLVLVLEASDPEFWLNILAFPLTLLFLVLAVYGVRNENKKLILGFMGGMVLATIYFLYKLISIYVPRRKKYENVKNGLTVFACATLLTVIGTTYQSYICYRNFGKGLSTHIKKDKTVEYLTKSPERTLNLGDD